MMLFLIACASQVLLKTSDGHIFWCNSIEGTVEVEENEGKCLYVADWKEIFFDCDSQEAIEAAQQELEVFCYAK